MKTIQKLEILAGMATFVAALLSFLFIDFPQMGQLEKLKVSNGEVLMRAFLFLFLPALLILIGTYLHVFNRSIIGLILIIVFGALTVFLHTVGFLIGSAFGGHPFLGILPGLFAAATLLLALYQQSVSSAPPEYAPPRR